MGSESFIIDLLQRLANKFRSISFLSGGYNDFQINYSNFCNSISKESIIHVKKFFLGKYDSDRPQIECTKILSFLYLGSQDDALSEQTINVSGL